MTAERMAVAFGRVLRGAGMRVPLDSVVTFVQCLDAVGITDRNRVYWAAHSALVRRPEDRESFNVAFAVFWERLSAGDDPETIGAESLTLAVDAEDGDGSGEANDDPAVTLRFSATETLRSKDFADYTTDELAEAQRLMARLRFAGSPRRSQRLTPSRTRTGKVDVRRTVRSSFAHLGEPVRREWREPSEKLRRLVVLLDVSGSMEPYARAFLRFMHAAMVGRQRVEAFTLGTRLTRVTRELTHRDPDKALERASRQVADWSGGTRIGECLRNFNDRWGVRGGASRGVGQPAEGHAWLCTTGARHGSRAAARRCLCRRTLTRGTRTPHCSDPRRCACRRKQHAEHGQLTCANCSMISIAGARQASAAWWAAWSASKALARATRARQWR
jgi:uncharacterized protein with von Willebrand factor type A (vWA) domain